MDHSTNLRRHHVSVDGRCTRCKEGTETTDHALFQCKRARKIWDVLAPREIKIFQRHMDIQDRWIYISSCSNTVLELICIGVWVIWNDRNHTLHNRHIPSINDRCVWINGYLEYFRKSDGASASVSSSG